MQRTIVTEWKRRQRTCDTELTYPWNAQRLSAAHKCSEAKIRKRERERQRNPAQIRGTAAHEPDTWPPVLAVLVDNTAVELMAAPAGRLNDLPARRLPEIDRAKEAAKPLRILY